VYERESVCVCVCVNEHAHMYIYIHQNTHTQGINDLHSKNKSAQHSQPQQQRREATGALGGSACRTGVLVTVNSRIPASTHGSVVWHPGMCTHVCVCVLWSYCSNMCVRANCRFPHPHIAVWCGAICMSMYVCMCLCVCMHLKMSNLPFINALSLCVCTHTHRRHTGARGRHVLSGSGPVCGSTPAQRLHEDGQEGQIYRGACRQRVEEYAAGSVV
jgi:hypothetical protein